MAIDTDQVQELVKATNGEVRLSADDIATAVIYPLKGKQEAKIFTFPDAGCC